MSSRFITSSLSALVLAGSIAACNDGLGPAAQPGSLTKTLASVARVELQATLAPQQGKAHFRSRGDERELQIEVEDLIPGRWCGSWSTARRWGVPPRMRSVSPTST